MGSVPREFDGLVANVKKAGAFLWCRELGQVFMKGSELEPLTGNTKDLKLGQWLRFAVQRQHPGNNCYWAAIGPQKIKPKAKVIQEATHPKDLILGGPGVAFRCLSNPDEGFIWSEALGVVQFTRSVVTVSTGLPPNKELVYFTASSSLEILKLNQGSGFRAIQVGPWKKQTTPFPASPSLLRLSGLRFDHARSSFSNGRVSVLFDQNFPFASNVPLDLAPDDSLTMLTLPTLIRPMNVKMQDVLMEGQKRAEMEYRVGLVERVETDLELLLERELASDSD